MSRSLRATIAAGAAVAVASVILLTGCASPAPTGPTLASTKSPAQLLRNEIAGRVPPAVIDELGETEDVSVGCGQNGLMRSWRSSALMFVKPSSAWRVGKVLSEVTKSLTTEGWNAEDDDSTKSVSQRRLTSPGKGAKITLTAVKAADKKGNGASLEIAVNGACVLTGGPDSEEVKKLE